MNADEIEETRMRYRARLKQFGADPRTLGWNKGRQRVRFAAGLESLREDDFGSVLDVGCGFGDLYAYLVERNWAGSYLGVDITPELISEARRLYENEGARFLCQDIRTEPPDTQYDLAISIGVFNHRLESGNLSFFESMLEIMWQSSKKVVVVDFLSDAAEIRRDELFYADPRVIYEIASKFSRRIVIDHGYMPFEFQVKIWHEDEFPTECPAFAPYRSLADG